MGGLKESIRTCVMFCLRVALRLFWVFGVKKNRVVFTAYNGRQYACNPKYLYLYLKKNFGDKFEFVWVLNDDAKDSELDGAKRVRFLSLSHLFYVCTSGTYVTNLLIEPFFPKRKSQTFLTTWHGGGAYKDAMGALRDDKNFAIKNKMRDKSTDFYLASCEAYVNVWKRDYTKDDSKVLKSGSPRCDIFFEAKNAVNLVKQKLGILPEKKVVLYCPTWRYLDREKTQEFSINLDAKQICEALSKRFGGEWVFLFRGHHYMQGVLTGDEIINVSSYPDMQEILLITDFMLNDYSSSQWEHALAGKYGLLYTPDLEYYESTQRFFTPINQWAYDFCLTSDDVVRGILEYDTTRSDDKIKEHLKRLGSFENGDACKRVADVILGRI